MSSSEWGPHHGVRGFARKGSGRDLFFRYVRMQQEDSHLQARERAFRKQIEGILILDFPDARTVKKIHFCFFFFSSHPDCGTLGRRQWHPTPVLLPGNSHGWRSLVSCSPCGR